MVDYYDIYEKMIFVFFSNSKIFRRGELDLCQKFTLWQHRITIGNPIVTSTAEYPVPMHRNASPRRKIFDSEKNEKYIFSKSL